MRRAFLAAEITSIGKPSTGARLAQELRRVLRDAQRVGARPRAPPGAGKPRSRSANLASASSADACVARSMRFSAVRPPPRRTTSRTESSG
jgi:hypothetical protein